MSLKDGLRELYHFIPQFVRIGRKYHALYKKYSELQYLPYEQRLAYQLQELQHIMIIQDTITTFLTSAVLTLTISEIFRIYGRSPS